MQKNKLIVFDIDGTLTDSVSPHQKAFVRSLKKLGVENIDSNFGDYKHHTDSYIAKQIFEKDLKTNFSKNILDEFESHLSLELNKFQIPEIHGAKSFIEDLESYSEYAVCYATGSLMKPACYKLDAIGVNYRKEVLVTSNNIHSREDIVSKAIEKAEKFYETPNFKRIISIGDGLWDLRTAQNLNLEFIGIGLKNKELLSQNGAQSLFDDFLNLELDEKTVYNTGFR